MARCADVDATGYHCHRHALVGGLLCQGHDPVKRLKRDCERRGEDPIAVLRTALSDASELAEEAIATVGDMDDLTARLAKLKAVRDGKEPQRKEGSQ